MSGQLEKPARDWSWIPNQILRNPSLSLKAKGLWVYLNSKPNGWVFSIDRIATEMSDGRDAVRTAIQELEQAGLLQRERKSVGTGWIEKYKLTTKKISSVGNSHDENSYVGKSHVGKPNDIIRQNIVRQNKVKKNKEDNLMSAPAKPAPTRELPNEAKELAHLLHYLILQNKPDRRIQDGWTDRWAEDIEKAHRIDGRGWEQLKAAIVWSQRDEFWKQNILSGEKLRKHYDRMSDRARAEREKNASQDVASAIFSQTNEQAVENARRLGLIH